MPRLGMGMPIVSSVSSAPVVAIDDFVFLNDVSGELTPNSTAVRKNLLVQSQTFKTTWAGQAAIPNDLYTAPDSTLTAQAITATSSGASDVYAQQVVATTAGETYTYSAHVKAGANGFVLLLFYDGTTSRSAYFNADTGSVGSASNLISTHFQKLDNGWFRVSITFQNTVTTSGSVVRIYSAAASGSTGTGAAFQAGTDLLYIWGAQLEEDSRPSNYIVTTNAAVTVAASFGDVSEVWDFDGTDIMLEASFSKDEGAFDRATQNLVLNGDYEELGSELASFSDNNITLSNLSDSTTISLGNNSYRSEAFGNTNDARPRLIIDGSAIVTGKTHEVTYTPTANTGGTVFDFFASGTRIFSNHDASVAKTFYFVASDGFDGFDFDGSETFRVDYTLSVKQVDPNNRWTLGTGWSISDGKAVSDNSGSGSRNLRQNGILTSGNTYEITFEADVTSGIVYLIFGGTTAISSSGTYTFYKTATSADFVLRNSNENFIGSIDNVTVTEYAITPKSV